MPNYEKLDPETRSYALVGQFLKRWSVMEAAVEACIKTAFKMSDNAAHIVCRHLEFSGKVFILRCVLDAADTGDSKEKESISSTLIEIENYAYKRNLVAHSPFEPDAKGDGVVFVEIRARAKFTKEEPAWSIADFAARDADLDRFTGQLRRLEALIGKHPMTDEAEARVAATSSAYLSVYHLDPYQEIYGHRRNLSAAIQASSGEMRPPPNDPTREKKE